MLGNVFLTFYRVTVRHPLYAALDLLGLSFGVAVFITLSLYVRFETSYESWLPNADQIYEARTRYTMPGKPTRFMEHTTAKLIETLKQDYPDLTAARMWEADADLRKGGTSSREHESLVDADFFKVFDLPMIAGDIAAALAEPGRVLLSESVARKYLGHGEGVGATIRLTDAEGDAAYVVAGILADVPRNSDFHFDIVRLLTPAMIAAHPKWSDWGAMPMRSFLRFGDKAQAEQQDAAFDAFSDRHLGPRENGQPMHTFLTWQLTPLRSLHLNDPLSRNALYTLGLVALLSLAVAAINHVNLATAMAGLRAREVAVRRTLGGTRGALARQFLLEAILTSLIAWIGGLSLVELALPLLNEAAGLSLSLTYAADGTFFLSMMGAVVLLGLLSGLYPAFVLSRFQPSQVLASSRWPSGGRMGLMVREALVVLQFTVVAVFFTLTWGFFSQIAHLKTVELGFRRDGLLVAETRDPTITPALRRQIWAAFRQVPGVVSVGSGDAAPGEESGYGPVVVATNQHPETQVSILRSGMEADFFDAYGATLLAGRFLDPDRAGEPVDPKSDAPMRVVLTAKAARAFGFQSPEQALGRTLVTYGDQLEVVGVVGDLRFRSPRTELEGIYYYVAFPDRLTSQITAVRYEGVPEPEIRARLAEAWRSVAPDIPLELTSAEDSLDKYYAPDRVRSRLFGMGATGAALIGALGLYGMAAFGASRRMLELAIRKVLGATRGTVVKLLVARFLRPVLLANILAAPIAYWVLAQWLVQFEDRIAITPTPFLVAGGAVLVIALTTVSALSFTAASLEPARILRRE